MPSVTRKTQSTRAKRRQEITAGMLSAVENLLEQPDTTYTELSVERLIAAADISRSTFYVYFEDKGDLLLALTEDVIDGVLQAAGHWWQLPADATKDDLRGAMQMIFDAYLPHRVVMAAVVEAASYDANVRETFGAMMQGAVEGVAAHIAAGQKSGFVRNGIDAQRTAGWLTWMTERGLYQLVGPATDAEQKQLLTALTDIVWNTLYEGTRRPPL